MHRCCYPSGLTPSSFGLPWRHICALLVEASQKPSSLWPIGAHASLHSLVVDTCASEGLPTLPCCRYVSNGVGRGFKGWFNRGATNKLNVGPCHFGYNFAKICQFFCQAKNCTKGVYGTAHRVENCLAWGGGGHLRPPNDGEVLERGSRDRLVPKD